MLNTRILSHPINWLIVFLMLVIAGMFGHLLMTLFNQAPATASNPQGSAPIGYSTQTPHDPSAGMNETTQPA